MYNVDIVVTDQVFYRLSVCLWASPQIDPKSQQKKPEDNQWAANSRGWTDVLEMDAVEAVRHFNASGRTLLMIWPGYADPMAYNAVESYQVYPLLALWAVTWTDSRCRASTSSSWAKVNAVAQQTTPSSNSWRWVVYNILPRCGLTMSAQEEWHLVETVDIPSWPEIHDRVQIYRRGST